MPRIPEIRSDKLSKILIWLWFEARKWKWSHTVFKHKDWRRTIVSNHSKPINIWTLRAILKQIKISIDDLILLLD